MFVNRARTVVLALSLLAAVGGPLPAVQPAAAALVTVTAESSLRRDLEQVPDPMDGLHAPKLSVKLLQG